MADVSRSVLVGSSIDDDANDAPPSGARFVRAHQSLSIRDTLLAVLISGLALLPVIRPGEPVDVSAAALAAVGALSLAWRRTAPIPVLLINAGAFCLYQMIGYPHRALPLAMLVAMYTVAARSGAVMSAIASIVLIAAAVGSDVGNGGWPEDYDDELFAFLLPVGAACALGYGVQLARARTQLLRKQAAELTSRHTAHETLVLRRERARIARELHDVVAHQVSVVTALATGAQRVLDSEPELARAALNSIEVAGREALTEMRRLLLVLRADSDDTEFAAQPGLGQLPALITQTEAAGLPVRLSVHGQPRALPVGVEVCAYRIVQEALTNVLKHAGPSRATVVVSYGPTLIDLRVCDDGRGFPPDPNAGQGLVGMRERAALVGGWLVVGAGSSGGVEVHCSLPTEGYAAA